MYSLFWSILMETPWWNGNTQSEYRAQLVNGEINVGIVVENVCHPLQAEGHMAGQVGGGRKVTWHRYSVHQPLSKMIGCQTSVQFYGPNVLSPFYYQSNQVTTISNQSKWLEPIQTHIQSKALSRTIYASYLCSLWKMWQRSLTSMQNLLFYSRMVKQICLFHFKLFRKVFLYWISPYVL